MASLIFWGPILTHKAVISHRREKQRIKNYERWEGLRDDYDEQRRVARESRSLDIQRTGSWDEQSQSLSPSPSPAAYLEPTRSYVSLRDQQEANDARTGWRPQEAWDGPKTQVQAQMTGQVQQYQRPHMAPQQHVSMTPTVVPQRTGSPALPLRSQKTGATWDEDLPGRLAVSRQSFDDYDHTQRYRSVQSTQSMPVSRDHSLIRQQTSYFSGVQPQTQLQPQVNTMSRQNSVSRSNPATRTASISRTQTPSGLRRESTPGLDLAPVERRHSPPEMQVTSIVELPKNEFGFVDPARAVAGGRMAELIERGY